MIIRFTAGTNRNTKCYDLEVAGVGMLISYETIVAASYRGERMRRRNIWGPTTGRHLKETNTYDWPEMDEAEFNAKLDCMLHEAVLRKTVVRLS